MGLLLIYAISQKKRVRMYGNTAPARAILSNGFARIDCGARKIGLMFKDAETMSKIGEKIEVASRKFDEIADIEEKACLYLKERAV